MSVSRSPKRRGKLSPPGSGSNSGRIVDRITQDLRELILEHKIAPGTVLIQTEWAEKLRVSRTPLREAFRILEQDGLVRVSNGNRTVQVVQFSDRELRDVYEVREVVDGLAARLLAIEGLTPDLDVELAGLLETMESSAAPFDPVVWFSAHTAFHLRIAESCGSTRVRQQASLIKMTSFSLHSFLAELPPVGGKLQHILEVAGRQHRAIFDALRSGSGDLAEMAACGHIRTTLQSDLIAGATARADAQVV
ncbi:GntR family transcriptional regulator [Nocardia fusca]|uniref:GntR family transcriptional regulator n=1 Tax=Nocardia fusca TaxID=941183 RepID=UPI0007A74C98|nr:GntR family transcriptional regulator [Nocardia fusca]